MKRVSALVILAVIATTLVAGCGGGGAGGATKTYTDTEKPIVIGSDEEFVIALENLSPGKVWEPNYNEDAMSLLLTEYEPNKKGTGGTDYFRFQPASATLSFTNNTIYFHRNSQVY